MSPEKQRTLALAEANERRSRMAQRKREISRLSQAAGVELALRTIHSPDPALRQIKLMQLLLCVRHIGEMRARRVLKIAELNMLTRISDLTDRQKGVFERQVRRYCLPEHARRKMVAA